MGHTCFDCGKNNPGKPEMIEFQHKKLTFKIHKTGLICRECEIKKHKELFDEYNEILISSENSEITVNWNLFCKKERVEEDETINAINDILISLGIFSLMRSNSWSIIADGEILLNPRSYFLPLFFTRRKDAEEYARVELSNTLYGWRLTRVAEVISKKEVLTDKKQNNP